MNAVVIRMYTQNVATPANAPGNATRVVTLGITQKMPGVAGPNDEVFKDGVGNAQFNLQNIAPEVFAGFEGGKSYLVTIQEAPAEA